MPARPRCPPPLLGAVTTRDASGQAQNISNFAVHFADLAELDRPANVEAPAVIADVIARSTRRPARRLTLAEELSAIHDSERRAAVLTVACPFRFPPPPRCVCDMRGRALGTAHGYRLGVQSRLARRSRG